MKANRLGQVHFINKAESRSVGHNCVLWQGQCQVFFHIVEEFYLLNTRGLLAVLLLPFGEWGWGIKSIMRIPGLILSYPRSACGESARGKSLYWGLFGRRDEHRLYPLGVHNSFCVYIRAREDGVLFQGSGKK